MVLGLLCAVFIALANPLKGVVSLLLGLLVACVGLDNPAGFPRFTFGNAGCAGSLAHSHHDRHVRGVEIVRGVAHRREPWEMARAQIGNVFRGMWGLTLHTRCPCCAAARSTPRSGVLPGAGADIAAWMSYAVSKKFS